MDKNADEITKQNGKKKYRKQKDGRAYIGIFEDLPEYEQKYSNKFILTGYRINHSTFSDII